MKQLLIIQVLILVAFSTPAQTMEGAWQHKDGSIKDVLLLADGYLTLTRYDDAAKTFLFTAGGPYSFTNNKLTVHYEFDTRDTANIGKEITYAAEIKNGSLQTNMNNHSQSFDRSDAGRQGLAGLWEISGRMQNGQMQEINRRGTRKTIKILTGSRFQWAAIDPGTKQFMGTGGGRYTFANGKYTEHIEFFSRDSSRVGQSLSFDGEIKNGDWHHSGLSSRGDPIYEVWRRSVNKN